MQGVGGGGRHRGRAAQDAAGAGSCQATASRTAPHLAGHRILHITASCTSPHPARHRILRDTTSCRPGSGHRALPLPWQLYPPFPAWEMVRDALVLYSKGVPTANDLALLLCLGNTPDDAFFRKVITKEHL